MTASTIKSITLERDLPFAQDRIWRALTQPELLAEWLMATDFAPLMGHDFRFTSDWVTVHCRLLDIAPQTRLSYSWAAHDVDTVLTWTLEPSATGTLLRLHQSGFRPDQPRAFGGARSSWARFLDALETLLTAADTANAP